MKKMDATVVKESLQDCDLMLAARVLYKRLQAALVKGRPLSLVMLGRSLYPDSSPAEALRRLECGELAWLLAMPENTLVISAALKAEAERTKAAVSAATSRYFKIIDEKRLVVAQIESVHSHNANQLAVLKAAGFDPECAKVLVQEEAGTDKKLAELSAKHKSLQAEFDALERYIKTHRDEDAPESVHHLLEGAK